MFKRLLVLVIVIVVIGIGIFFVMNGQSDSTDEGQPQAVNDGNEPYDPSVGLQDRVFLLKGDRRFIDGAPGVGRRGSHSIVAVVILPDTVRTEVIQAAWSYVVRNSADGLDVPNYHAAVQLLMERHPSWQAGVTKGYTVSFDFNSADEDIPD